MNRPIALEPPPTQAAIASGSAPYCSRHCWPGLVADAAGEVADHARERVRAGGRAEEVRRVVDAGDPVAQRLVDGVLERGAAGLDRDHLGAEEVHPGDVERLPLGVDRAHVDGAVEAEVRRGGGAGDAVLAGAGLGDHPGLAHPLGQQRLAEHVADLVGAGVVEVLALEQDPGADLLAEPLGVVERARHAGVLAQDAVELRDELRVGHRLLPGDGQLVERGDQRLGHEPAAEVAEPAALVGVERRSCSHSCHRADGGLGVAVPDQRLADQDHAAPSATNRSTSSGPEMPDSATSTRSSGTSGASRREGVVVDLEGLEVAGVDADQLGAEGDRALGLRLVVDLDQHGQAELAGLVVQPAQLRRRRARPRSAAPGRRRRRGPRAAGSR